MISSHSSTPTRFLHSLKNLEQSSHSSSSRRKNSIPSQFKSSSSRFSFFNAILTLTISILLIGRVNCQSSSSSSTDMSLPLDLSLPRACTPLNITFPVSDDAFPYTVWIVGNYSAVPTWRVDSDYPRSGPNNDSVTFQYSVPAPNGHVSAFSVSVGDSQGRANSSGLLSMTTDHGAPSSCNPWTENNNFYWGLETLSEGLDDGLLQECEEVLFYNIDLRGMAPFTLTFLPLGSHPQSINLIPNVTKGLTEINATSFQFHTYIPFAAGTLLEIVMGDSVYFGGGGGASRVFTIAPNRNSTANLSCASDMKEDGLFNNQTALIVPQFPIASFNNLDGAISEYPVEKKNNAAIIGGVIGATVAVGLLVAALVLFFLYRKRQQRKREELMWKEPKFVEVDERDGGRGWRRGVNQTYSVSPFAIPGSGSSGTGSSAPSAQGGVPPQTHASVDSTGGTWRSGTGSGTYSGVPNQASSQDSPPISPSSGGNGGYSTVPTSSSFNWPPNQSSSEMNRSSSQVQHHQRDLQQFGAGSAADSYVVGSRTSIPMRTGDLSLMDAEIESSTGGTLMTQTDSQGGTRRVLVHSDGGFLQGDSLDDDDDQEDVDELPPSYDRDWGSNTQSSTSTSNPNPNSTSEPNTNPSENTSNPNTPLSISTSTNPTTTMNPSPLRQEAFTSESETATTTTEESQREREIRERIERERREQDADNAEMWLSSRGGQ